MVHGAPVENAQVGPGSSGVGVYRPTVTTGAASSTGYMVSAIRMASSMRVSTIIDSGTVLTTSPRTKI